MALEPGDTRQRRLNRLAPAASRAKMGDVLADLIAQHNKVVTDLAAIKTAAATSLATVAAVTLTAVAVTDLESR